MTPSVSPTATPTPTHPFPAGRLHLRVYNSAGEAIRSLAEGLVTDSRVTGIEVSQAVLVAGQGGQSLGLRLVGPSGLALDWDGRSDTGLLVQAGTYIVRAEIVDEFGRVESHAETVMVLRLPRALSIGVYNSAGELVRALEGRDGDPPAFSELSLSSGTLVLGGGEGGQAPKLGLMRGDGTDWVSWDGANAQGRLVDSGVYTLKIESKEQGSDFGIMTKSVQVIRMPAGDPLESALIAPNPLGPRDTQVVVHLGDEASLGLVKATFYNLAGERLATVDNAGWSNKIVWDLAKKTYGSGSYLCVLESGGEEPRKRILKFSLARWSR